MSTFNFLSGKIHILDKLPDTLQTGLDKFYSHPNSAAWPQQTSRILMHESFHFWHVISSGYLANIVQDEWFRLLQYETTGEIREPSKLSSLFRERVNQPFSPAELFECWARYWDVHTYNPEKIVEYDGIISSGSHIVEGGYSGKIFDLAMTQGEKHCEYSAPYRWVLELLNESKAVHQVAANRYESESIASYLASLTFPCVVSSAFASPDPIAVFNEAYKVLATNQLMIQEIIDRRELRINFAWLKSWTFSKGELIYPVLETLNLPAFTSGLDVIKRGLLSTHPVYSKYLQRHVIFQKLGFAQWRNNFIHSEDAVSDLFYFHALTDLPLNDFWALYSQPGQPEYRQLLGFYMHPPVVAFFDDTIYPKFPFINTTKEEQLEQIQQWQEDIKSLDQRISDFELALYTAAHDVEIAAY